MTAWRRAVVPLLAAALALTACGRDDDDDGAEPGGGEAQGIAEGPATGTIDVWAMGVEGENLSVLATDFKAENPDVTVNVTPVPWDEAHDKISTAIAGGVLPDVSLVGTTWMGEFAGTGALDPTPDLIDESTFFPGAWETTVVDGTSYGVPWYVETRLIYYRSDLAEQAGAQPPTSWDELKAFAMALEEQGAEYGINLQAGGTGAWQTFMPFVWQAGGEVLGESGEFALDSQPVVQALDYYKSFFAEGLSPEGLQPGELETGFINGTIGAFVSGPWHIGILRDQGGAEFEGKFAVAPMPREQAGTSFVGGGDLVVFKNSDNRDAAWKFVEYLSQPEVQVKWYETVNDLPSIQSAWNDPALTADPMLATFGTQLQDAKSPPAIATWEQVASVVDTELEKVTIGGMASADAASAMQEQAASIGTGG